MEFVVYADGSLSSDPQNLLHDKDKGRRLIMQVSREVNGFAAFAEVTDASKIDDLPQEFYHRIPTKRDKKAYDDSLRVPVNPGRKPVKGAICCTYLWGQALPSSEMLCAFSLSFVNGVQAKIKQFYQ